ncbi:hypothetical protein [Gemmata sp.]|uniref:hypothetical protein n=1 Tax=Gemmata sp. TaxID=1914242 RepID=UPI003F70E610
MTEAEWLRSMALPPARRLTRRVEALFAVACIHRTTQAKADSFLQKTTALVEEAAESGIWSKVDAIAPQAASNCVGVELGSGLHFWKIAALRLTTAAYQAPMHLLKALEGSDSVIHLRRLYLKLLTDITGNPLRGGSDRRKKPIPLTEVQSMWRTSTAVALAQQMYDSRDFSTMPILADALQDAGCDNDDILNHCRDANGVHVRGCWVVDLVLGKT